MRAALILAVALFVVGCGERTATNVAPTKPVVDGWQTYIDPVTDVEFRCVERWVSTGYAGGLAMWCYQVNGTTP